MAIHLLKPYKRWLVSALLIMLLSSAVSLSIPWLAGNFAQGLLADVSLLGLTESMLIALLLIVFFLRGTLVYVGGVMLSSINERVLSDLKVDLYDHIQRLPYQLLGEHRRGDLLSVFTYDSEVVTDFIVDTSIGLIPLAFTLVGAVFLIFRIDPAVAMLVFILLPLAYLPVRLLRERMWAATSALHDAYAKSMDIVDENVAMLPLIKSSATEDLELERFKASTGDLASHSEQLLKIRLIIGPLVQFFGAVAVAALLWVAVVRNDAGSHSIAELVQLLLYGMLLASPISSLANLYGEYQSARIAFNRIARFLQAEIETIDEGTKVNWVDAPAIECRNLSFGYGVDNSVVNGLNFKIEAGETVVITGRNGAGKSTLMHLICRLMEPSGGQILIGGHDISAITMQDVRRHIGYVAQDSRLFNRSIADNISYGQKAFDADQASSFDWLLDFVSAFEQGYQTSVGERGGRLSGGQRQRVSLARMLNNRYPILILDEATAMLDPAGGIKIVENRLSLLKGRTVIIVSHDPVLQKLADRVLSLENGQLVELSD